MTETGNAARNDTINALYAAALVHSAVREGRDSTFPSTRLAVSRSPELQSLIVEHSPVLLKALATLSEERRQ